MADKNQSTDVPPPPYSLRPSDSLDLDRQESRDSPPAYTTRPEVRRKPVPLQPPPSEPSSSRRRPRPTPPSEPSSSKAPKKNFFKNAVEAYEEKRRIKESQRKVDYYEKLYGFVPKNVMTEAEWREARGRMPKEKVPTKLTRKGFFDGTGFTYLASGFGGSGGC